MSTESRWGPREELEPIVSDEVMPEFLVAQGYQAGWKPRVRIIGNEGWDSYNFKFHSPLQPDVLPEEVENLFPRRGATGSVGYVRREAAKFRREVLSSGASVSRRSDRVA